MEKDVVIQSPKNNFLDFLTYFVFCSPIFLALSIKFLNLKISLDIRYFIIYSLTFSLIALLLLVNFNFRNNTVIKIKKDDKVYFYRYKKYRLDLMFHIENIESIVVRRRILGIKLKIFIKVDNTIWSINNIHKKEKIYINILINDEMLLELEKRLFPFKTKWKNK